MPKVINRHHFRGTHLPRPWIYIGRGTPLGNPYTAAEYGVEALKLYRRHLWDRLRARDASILAELRRITDGHHLVCSCAPKPCHGDVVVSCWSWLRKMGLDAVPRAGDHLRGTPSRPDGS